MNYETHHPGHLLGDFVKCFWALEGSDTGRQRIVSDGCMEMIFHCGDRYRQFLPDGSSIIQPRSFVFGQITHPLEIVAEGITNIFAVRFQPDGFMPFATLPILKMENRAVPLNELFDKEGDDLEKKVLTSVSTSDRIRVAEDFLLKKLQSPDTVDRIARSSVALLLELNGQLSVEELAGTLNTNRRQLERRFASTIGISPKQFSKIARFQSAIRMLQKKKYSSLTSLAYENGYFDQAHFIRDFKEFTGMSPSQFYSGNLKLTGLFVSE